MTQKSLFEKSEPGPKPRPASPPIQANIDGGARGNPGPAAYGVIVRDAKGEIIAELSDYLGLQTNNYAEYSGLLAALEFAVREKHPSLKVLSDSELLVRQMQGRYKVKSPGLIDLYDRARTLVRKLEHFSIDHVLRQYNKDADALVNQVLDSRGRGTR
ncbi:MAG TPA: ribonuclease HI family protein [Candidatus Angelobacter sp.]|jgi:probable phosphoglycerate mutase|nr:ribonuclease HI family protein [Candidatus Angelobacter sp.]